ncbi:hypothetical protein KAFR_0A03430 [Kazachstania africana CBS 2517]|uniref:SET domain-containing protein n=1 Tax=Kazachstania africana (strain ATCC 22294 / BCRC 22015 / CBS 2517 / CECT 1963 / NBRC 1671 / NRRL Y-8276) TaxID=1071382 RepID=H2AN28_KAZAF|nr:hypothetical protein KAFR_0A03430 [Kazachstania africana CBS 2517]CCF55778.1 hypothetical protein KAFR_0A03430 [Kazachstania africana CBS 2517]
MTESNEISTRDTQKPLQQAHNQSLLDDASTLLLFSQGNRRESQQPSKPTVHPTTNRSPINTTNLPPPPVLQPMTRPSFSGTTVLDPMGRPMLTMPNTAAAIMTVPTDTPTTRRKSSLQSNILPPVSNFNSVQSASQSVMNQDMLQHQFASRSESIPSSSIGNTPPKSRSRSITNKDTSAIAAAAAALATAANIPLPLRKHELEVTQKKEEIEENDEEHEEHPKKKSKTAKDHEWPIPDSYVVDQDSGIITCICEFNDDDGFTVQCEHCNRWQHAICYGIERVEDVPDLYLCNACNPRKLDIKHAKMIQKNRKENDLIHKQENEYNQAQNNRRRRKTESTNEHDNKSTETQNDISTKTDNKDGSNDRDSNLPPDNNIYKKKEHMLTASDAYAAVYLSLNELKYKDKYVKLFLENHINDDCVIPYKENEFSSIPIDISTSSDASYLRSFPGFSKLGIAIQQDCNKNDLICELLGELDFQRNYITNPRNHYRIWGTTKRKVFFHPDWPLVLDERLCGNLTRYLRRSCYPNVELVTIRLKDNSIKFVLRALQDLEKGDELHIGWNWDFTHPILQLIKGNMNFDALDDNMKFTLIHSVDTILGSCECACGNNSKDCHLLKVKKLSTNLYKSVKSKMNNRFKLNEILNHYQSKRNKRPEPILDCLVKQANERESKDIPHPPSIDESIRMGEKKNEGVLEHDIQASSPSSPPKNNTQPFKLKLYENYHTSFKTIDSLQSTASKIPSEYDESDCTELDKLAIPIPFPLPMDINDKSPKAVENSEQLNESKTLELSDKINKVEEHSQNIKKKLSFADYRKKQHK